MDGDEGEDHLPRWLGYMNTAALLIALDDKLMQATGLQSGRDLGYLRSLGDIRNSSHLAHGANTVKAADAAKLRERARLFLAELWKLDGREDGLDETCERLRFVTFG